MIILTLALLIIYLKLIFNRLKYTRIIFLDKRQLIETRLITKNLKINKKISFFTAFTLKNRLY